VFRHLVEGRFVVSMQGGAFKCKGKKKPLECFPFKIIKLTQLSISHELYYCFPMLNPMDFNGKKKVLSH
jgi:hypothetical protein